MKQLLNHSRMVLLALMFSLCGTMAFGQITITKADFNADPDERLIFTHASPTGHSLPEMGANKTWDFSNYAIVGYNYEDYSPSNYPALPRAFRKISGQDFLSLNVETYFQFAYDSVYGPFAVTLDTQAVSLGGVTGNANDTVIVYGNSDPFVGGAVKDANFPMTYNKTWSSNSLRILEFDLTVAAYALNHVPGEIRQLRIQKDSVLGWGTVIIPQTGGGTITKDVLVVKSYHKEIDSTYLGGAVAPPTLVAAFGLQQGVVKEETEYRFYAKGTSQPIVSAWTRDGGKTLDQIIFKSFFNDLKITSDEYLVEQNQTIISFRADPTAVQIPQTGYEKVWDYSNLMPVDTVIETYTAANIPSMPRAFKKLAQTGYFFGFPAPVESYIAYDDSSYGVVGAATKQRSAFSLTAISGGPNDSLVIPVQEHYYGQHEKSNFDFPLRYLSTYSTKFSLVGVDAFLTVKAFALNNAPVQGRASHWQYDTVVGYGWITLPLATGGTMQHKALLIKTFHYDIETFYLYGAPAPPALLAALGLTQGDTTGTYVRYTFLTENLNRSLLQITTLEDGITPGNVTFHPYSQNRLAYLPITAIRSLRPNDGEGKPDSLNNKVRVRGIVNDFNHDGSRDWLNFAIQDGTDGIVIFKENDTLGYEVKRGDSVEVFGDVAFFNGLTEIHPDSINVLSRNNTEDVPRIVTMLDELTEAELVRINDVRLVNPSQWGQNTFSFNVDVANGTDTFTLRIEEETDLFTAPAPKGWFAVVGIGWQSDANSPYDEGYQLVPRSSADIIPVNFPQTVVINEFLADNQNAQKDPAGEYDDWIELYNTGSSAIEMQGYYLSNDKSNTMMWEMPAATLPDSGYLTIWADNDMGQSGLHAPFELQNSGEIYLSDPNGNVIDSVIYSAQKTDTSFARLPNGTGAFDFGQPTLGAENKGWPNGISERDQYQFSIYPTALKGSGQVTLNLSATHPGKLNFSITSTHGQELLQEHLQMEKGKASYRFSLPANWSAGMYLCHITNDSGKLIWYGKILVE